MIGLLRFVLAVLASPFKSKLRPEAENAALRHQLIVLRELVLGAYNGGGMYVGPWAQAHYEPMGEVMVRA
jgi:hypothetical protein